MKVIDIVRGAIPEVSQDEYDFILWNRTGFPQFWKTDNPAREIYESARRYGRAKKNNITMCDLCDRKLDREGSTCSHCYEVLHK